MGKQIKIHPLDNVSVAIEDCSVEAGHKIALKDIAAGEDVIKYGYPIGHALSDVALGAKVDHTNLKTNLEDILEYSYNPVNVARPIAQSTKNFKGYRRANGEVGVRNEIWIVPTVGCVNGTAKKLAELGGAFAFTHNYGCSQLGEDHENSRKILRNVVLHPNAGGVLVIGLGCENNQLSEFRKLLPESDRIKFMETQKIEGDEIEYGLELIKELHALAAGDIREEVPYSELRVGLKCGGSDGFSGITANPLLGAFTDFLVSQGGTAVLTEVPEMFGAETILMNRCRNVEVFGKCVRLINSFKEYFIENNQHIYENPSPGNKAGGISTLEEKSLGCTQKCGSAAVEDVLMYGERLVHSGLNLLSSPGNDLVASTALAAAGCHIVLFTTGRGTPFGTFVPTMKISTNTTLANAKPHWIDFDAGVLLTGENMAELCNKFTDYVTEVVQGREVNNEKSGFREISIFKTGVTL